MKRRTLPLSVWLVGGLVAMVVVGYLGAFLMAFSLERMFSPPRPEPSSQPQRDPASFEDLYLKVESQSDRWWDPAWQDALREELIRREVALTIRSADKRQIFLFPDASEVLGNGSGAPAAFETYQLGRTLRQVVVYSGANRVGQVDWRDIIGARQAGYIQPVDRSQMLIPLGIFLAVAITIWVAVTVVSRAVFKPLGAIARAARQINQGDLELDLPVTRITEVNDFVRAFGQMRDGLKESLSAQSQLEQERRLFVAAVAHDLRTPLTSVRGYLEGIRDGVARTPEMVDQYVGVALAKTASLERLVDGLFAYSRTEYLEQPPQKEPLQLGALIEAAARGIQPQAEARGVDLDLDAGPEDCVVNGDPAMLSRVIDNLLDNALRYTPQGGQITVGWRAGIGHGKCWVQDTGPGIPEEDLAHVFKPLYRADKARGTRTGGAGLGLAIARRLVEAHGGSITVENRGGARFTIILLSAP
jgi:signal transduction histidine kinase